LEFVIFGSFLLFNSDNVYSGIWGCGSSFKFREGYFSIVHNDYKYLIALFYKYCWKVHRRDNSIWRGDNEEIEYNKYIYGEEEDIF